MPTRATDIFFLFIIILSFFAALRYIERHSIFFPMKEIETVPTAVGLPYEDLFFKTSDRIILNGWFIPNKGSKDIVLFFHGNAGNISHRLEKIDFFYNLGLNIFIIDYRGYGKSKGSPSEKGLYKDAEAAYEYLLRQKGAACDNIILYGESLGTAIAVNLASRKDIKALILEEPFTSVKDMVRVIYPFMPYFILESRFDSASKIRGVKAPKLIMHSVDDEIVPFRLGEKLFQAAPGPKKFLKLRGGHNTAFLDSKEVFESGVSSFLANR